VSRSFTVLAASFAPTAFAISISIASRYSPLPPKYESSGYGFEEATSAATCVASLAFWSELSLDRSSAVRMSHRLACQARVSVAYSSSFP